MRPRPALRRAAALAGAAFTASALSCAAAEEAGEGLYRKGTPPVLKPAGAATAARPPAEVPSAAARDAFRRAYRQAGSPRLAVFWNRVFDDRLREMEAESRLVVKGKRDAWTGKAGETATERDRGELTVSLETRRDGGRPWPLSEAAGFRFQTGFLGPLIESGASVVDRAAVMRLTAAQRGFQAVGDRQLVETTALMEHADLLIQIAFSPSDESPTGALFHVSVVDVETGRVAASFFDDVVEKKRWAAAPGGYVRVEGVQTGEGRSVDLDLERTGRVLAARAMDALARAFAAGNEKA